MREGPGVNMAQLAHNREQRDARLRRIIVASAALDAARGRAPGEGVGDELAARCRDGRFSDLGDGSPAARLIGEFALAKMCDLSVGDIDEEERAIVDRAVAMVAEQ